MSEDSAAEQKRKRLEAWKKKRQQAAAPAPAPVKISMSLNVSAKQTKKKNKFVPPPPSKSINPFGVVDDDDEDDDSEQKGKRLKLSLGLGLEVTENVPLADERPATRRRGRWDATNNDESRQESTGSGDTLEKFMDKLEAGAMGSVVTQISESTGTELLSIDVGGSMMRVPKFKQYNHLQMSGGVITPEELVKLSSDTRTSKAKAKDQTALGSPSDGDSKAREQSATAGDVSAGANISDRDCNLHYRHVGSLVVLTCR
jgi:hypothetical protein